MYCSHCGLVLPNNTNYCMRCGNPQNETKEKLKFALLAKKTNKLMKRAERVLSVKKETRDRLSELIRLAEKAAEGKYPLEDINKLITSSSKVARMKTLTDVYSDFEKQIKKETGGLRRDLILNYGFIIFFFFLFGFIHYIAFRIFGIFLIVLFLLLLPNQSLHQFIYTDSSLTQFTITIFSLLLYVPFLTVLLLDDQLVQILKIKGCLETFLRTLIMFSWLLVVEPILLFPLAYPLLVGLEQSIAQFNWLSISGTIIVIIVDLSGFVSLIVIITPKLKALRQGFENLLMKTKANTKRSKAL